MLHKLILCLALAVATLHTTAQQLTRVDTINVTRNGKTLRWPWAGGHNSATLHSIDLNLDGIKDLLVFDRDGNTVTTFLNQGIVDSISYVHAPQYETSFPPLNAWVQVVDYNCDGKEDIFTYRVGYGCAQVWKNTSTATQVSFTLALDKLFYSYGPAPTQTTNVYIVGADIPVIKDIDHDGDVDVLVWDNLYSQGSKIWLYSNQRVELGYHCDSLTMQVTDSCWGRFTENFNDNGLTLGACPYPFKLIPPSVGVEEDYTLHAQRQLNIESNLQTNGVLHTGGTLAVYDANCDNAMEVLIGDVSFPNVVGGTNTGTPTKANITSVDTAFPHYNVPIRMSIFPAVSTLDINNDGKVDVFASPNAIGASSENKNCIQYYKNTGATCAALFSLENKSFLNSESIDVGTNAHPTFVDFDGDNKLDLVIGNHYAFSENYVVNKYVSKLTSQLDYYRNTGTASAPKFTLVTTDVDSISKINKKNLHATFGDLDNDGDLDMIIGESTGKFMHYQNTAGAGNTPHFNLITTTLKDNTNTIMSAYSNATPQLVDVNDDGKLDILSGSARGTVFYYENIGTLTAPSFEFKSDTLGGIDTRDPQLLFGNSCPQLVTEAGNKILYVSTAKGSIHKYNNITNANLYGYFNKLTNKLDSIDLGDNTYLSIGAFGANKRAFVVGTSRGGVVMYYDTNKVTQIKNKVASAFELKLYPNPTNGIVNVSSIYTMNNTMVNVYNIMGMLVYQGVWSGYKYAIDLSAQPVGMYIVNVKNTTQGIDSNIKVVLN
ncbi:MAG: FG-GAP-like repeat-containing protein [Bacteroidia bacterium]